MPELPEVEGVRHYLDRLLTGRTVTAVTVVRPKIIAHPAPEVFVIRLTGQTFAGVERRAKFLLLRLTDGGTLVLHLRMTGLPLVVPTDAPQEKHTQVILNLDNSTELRYLDQRQFGRFWLLEKNEHDDCTGLAKLGPEPLSRAFGPKKLAAALGGRKCPIKTCLLDQHTVAGIGNIYADEILFAARIRPDRPACALSPAELSRIAREIKQILAAAVAKDCLSVSEYDVQHGVEQRDAEKLLVYGRAGEPCVRCGMPLVRTVIGQRSSYYCPHCQH
ncbi:MAG: bifunctional DNA-formamidopyrimidine glycosylase/DNA-(apurinic or apyrimidinic site) lyase [Candidatus Methanomethylophilus sp.]|nr:bifunctional DNA-formamidopyrimidine glycosylase/DNA-(apurinic or apyrimidinic site) lyase [Methanomethylophilus sp.]MDD3232838.1 bifunctional DNA-formamidopyrimidine glycosylase/DNA-(apurinic or apyrimidinic site) lyase [Methanomethylophilus sp.]MDD4222260.1 bifunctional DNA-formamidopyrimidine glycosylase/DNA-(apurinic or apyrimidinic site) lyase [Methanomethylophilus sp.]MDD4668688.1 bifunctional DNA-formamidopyrimidine glycosylase/DNA-(apurinic or apyrimidinic site) lyase [Methanomethylop